MAATLLYAVVGNIPGRYHSSDLRNFFSRIIETDGFECFHFRHRPEARETERNPEISSDCPQNNTQEETHGRLQTKSKRQDPKPSNTCCCVIRLSESQYKNLLQMYNCRHWITEKGESMRNACHIRRIKVNSRSKGDNIEPQYKTRLEQSQMSSDREEFYEEDLKNLAELHPPTVMPKGNVGTPTLVFLDLIRQCLLPPKIISKLKLKFPKMTLNKKYGNVPFDYENSDRCEVDEENVTLCWLPITSASGHELQMEEEEKRGNFQSSGEKNVRAVEDGGVGAEQRILGRVMMANDSNQGMEGKEAEGRNHDVEAEMVMERKEIEEEEEEESDYEEEKEEERDGLEEEEEERKKTDGYEKNEMKVVEEREIEKEVTGEEKEDVERKLANQQERRKVSEYKESHSKTDRTDEEGDLKEKRKSFKEHLSRGHQSEKSKATEEGTLSLEPKDDETRKRKEIAKQNAKWKRKQEMAARRKKMALRIEEKMIEFERGSDHSEDDVDGCEEWERHEALHDDPSNQERNEERLFEQEIELKWEKGGSGLVFYTDAQFWKQQEGDFDEQTADDWDVDMSGYYEAGGGDMDGRDLIRIRRDQRRRDGIEDEHDIFGGIGKFEKHTKGFGRKIMERHGWKDGDGLGSSASGISEALTNDGQNPHCKTGFGFQEPKRQKRTGTFYKKRQELQQWHGPIISTVYDDPSVTDPGDPLLRRNEPYQLKRRKIDIT